MNREAKYYQNNREDLIELIPDSAKRIFDVGCGVGNLGATIKKLRGSDVEVVGIELDIDSAEKAKKNIDKVIIGDVESTDFSFQKGYFDCIVYGDILEHLVSPWRVLKKHRDFLKPHGYTIASIPNIAHYRTLKMLRRKEWEYKNSGVLDECHLRFFTIKSIRKMFEDAGFKMIKIGHIISASKVKKALNKILFNSLIDFITEQYLIIAEKIE